MKKPVKKAQVIKTINSYVNSPVTVIGGVVMPLKDALEFDRK